LEVHKPQEQQDLRAYFQRPEQPSRVFVPFMKEELPLMEALEMVEAVED
jgi:hypothetical protein